MGNAAAKPISAQECAKYGITMEDVSDFNHVVSETKRRKTNKKLDKKDIDNIHKYCIDKKTKKSNKGGGWSKNRKQIDKLIEDRLSLADPSVTMSTTEFTDRDMSSSLYTTTSSRGSTRPPSLIQVNKVDEEPSVLGNDYSVVLNSAEA